MASIRRIVAVNVRKDQNRRIKARAADAARVVQHKIWGAIGGYADTSEAAERNSRAFHQRAS